MAVALMQIRKSVNVVVYLGFTVDKLAPWPRTIFSVVVRICCQSMNASFRRKFVARFFFQVCIAIPKMRHNESEEFPENRHQNELLLKGAVHLYNEAIIIDRVSKIRVCVRSSCTRRTSLSDWVILLIPRITRASPALSKSLFTPQFVCCSCPVGRCSTAAVNSNLFSKAETLASEERSS